MIGADPERGHTAAAVYVDNAPLAATAAMCRALPKSLPGKLPSSIFGKVGARWERAATGASCCTSCRCISSSKP